jgi:hypothetical protein
VANNSLQAQSEKAILLEKGVWPCLTCNVKKPIADFYKSKSKRWPNSHCKGCQNQSARLTSRSATLRYLYGISEEQYLALLASQENCCAICGLSQDASKRMFSVDHDHTCCPGKRSCGLCVRGILCNRCNIFLGHANDSVEKLRSAILYLER